MLYEELGVAKDKFDLKLLQSRNGTAQEVDPSQMLTVGAVNVCMWPRQNTHASTSTAAHSCNRSSSASHAYFQCRSLVPYTIHTILQQCVTMIIFSVCHGIGLLVGSRRWFCTLRCSLLRR
jgi:hypothetical protein